MGEVKWDKDTTYVLGYEIIGPVRIVNINNEQSVIIDSDGTERESILCAQDLLALVDDKYCVVLQEWK